MTAKRIPKIAIEEAVSIPELTWKSKWFFAADKVDELNEGLLDIHESRLAKMDKLGVEFMVLSLTSPGPQDEPDPEKAHDLAVRANNYLAAEVAKNPVRFGGFASLSMHDPDVAAKEATRAVKELGHLGIILNDFQTTGEDKEGIIFYDQPQWDPFWAVIEELDVPVYIHPRLSTPYVQNLFFGDRPWLRSSAFGFAVGVSLHVLGMYTNGVFDRFPKLKIAIGHMGEFVGFPSWRTDHRLFYPGRGGGPPAKKRLEQVMRENLYVTTSGHFSTPALRFAIEQFGIDHVLFSIDYPYEKMEPAADWFDAITELSDEEKQKVASLNAQRLLGRAARKD